MIGRGAVHTMRAQRNAPEYIAAAHNDADLDAELHDRADLPGDKFDHVGTDPEALFPHQGFTAQFNGNTLKYGLVHLYTPAAMLEFFDSFLQTTAYEKYNATNKGSRFIPSVKIRIDRIP
jgi:hypothetical protein